MSGCIAINYSDLERFFRSVAFTVSTADLMKTKWVEYKDSTCLNIAYTLLFWKEGPGQVEVDMGSVRELEDLIEKKTHDYVMTFFTKLFQDPSAAFIYKDQLEQIKLIAIRNIQQTFQEVSANNQQVVDRTNDAIRRAAIVKLTGGIGLSLLGCSVGILAVGGATTVGGVSLGANALYFVAVDFASTVTHSIIKTWEQGSTVKAVAIDFGKTVASVGIEPWAERHTASQVTAATLARDRAQKLVTQASKLVKSHHAHNVGNLAKRTALKSHANRMAIRASVAMGAAKANRATVMKAVGYGLPVVFAAWDIRDKIVDYNEVIDSTR